MKMIASRLFLAVLIGGASAARPAFAVPQSKPAAPLGIQAPFSATQGGLPNAMSSGADPTGASDSTAAFNSSSSFGTTFVPPGTYKLGTLVTSDTPFFALAATLTQGGLPIPYYDLSILNNAGWWSGRRMSRVGSQWGTYLFGYDPYVAGSTSYEKGVLNVQMEDNNPSIPSSGVIKDDVAMDMSAFASPTNYQASMTVANPKIYFRISAVTTAASATSASNTLSVSSATGIVKGNGVIIAGLPTGVYVTDISGTTITLSGNVTAASGVALAFGSDGSGSVMEGDIFNFGSYGALNGAFAKHGFFTVIEGIANATTAFGVDNAATIYRGSTYRARVRDAYMVTQHSIAQATDPGMNGTARGNAFALINTDVGPYAYPFYVDGIGNVSSQSFLINGVTILAQGGAYNIVYGRDGYQTLLLSGAQSFLQADSLTFRKKDNSGNLAKIATTGFSVTDGLGIATAGSDLSSATLLNADVNEVTTCTSGGVRLRPWDSSTSGLVNKQDVINACGTSFPVYPSSSTAILNVLDGTTGALAAGASYSLSTKKMASFWCVSASLCYLRP